MSLLEHLEELRKRIIHSGVYLIVAFFIAYAIRERLSAFMVKPITAALKAHMICKGAMKGTGDIEIAYQGAEHYAGSYSFKGTLAGNPTSVVTRFKGDWVKADCGKVAPYKLRTQ